MLDRVEMMFHFTTNMHTGTKDAVKTLVRIVEMHHGVTCLEVEYNLDS